MSAALCRNYSYVAIKCARDVTFVHISYIAIATYVAMGFTHVFFINCLYKTFSDCSARLSTWLRSAET